ncbi:uncharacterized protein LOC124922489 [Impatiens glandulifera]|uniref:uncharacterized protein LOC124922489 n=1 Tax=Impatiens glandulifera TaxID=253017 RepID=UPI001FB0864F|nr:uncharacterized protein LOC124922489 [Impatiens glandulifera]
MSCLQAIACLPSLNKNSTLNRGYRLPKASLRLTPKASLRLTNAVSVHKRFGPVCLFGDKKKPDNPSEASSSPWKNIENAMGRLKKEQSIEDLLRQQIDKQEYFPDNDGNKGGNSPGGGGGGGGGGGSSGESEEGGIAGIVDEFVQVILATLGFIFLYIYIIEAEDITRLFQDMIKFIFSGKKSIRLKRLFLECGSFYQNVTRKEEVVVVENWLETAILQTPTMYDSIEKYEYILKSYMKSKSDD